MGGKIFEEGERGGKEEKWEKLFRVLWGYNKEKEKKGFAFFIS